MWTFLFWMVHCWIWNRSTMGFVTLAHYMLCKLCDRNMHTPSISKGCHISKTWAWSYRPNVMQSQHSWKQLCKFWINSPCISNLQQHDINLIENYMLIDSTKNVSHSPCARYSRHVTSISFLWRFWSTGVNIPRNVTPREKCYKVFFTSSFMVVIMWITMVMMTEQSRKYDNHDNGKNPIRNHNLR